MRKSAWGTLAIVLMASTALGRTWTSNKGTRIEADYKGHKDGKIVLLVKATSKILELSPADLSEEDQAYAAELEANASNGSALEKKLAEDATNPQNLVARGKSLLNKGKPEEAMSDFNAAIALDPKNAEAYDGRGLAYKKLGDAAKAHNDFTKATQVDEKFAWAYRHRAENLLDYIKTPEGIPVFEKAKAEFDKNKAHMAKSSFDHAPWQPVHSTRGKEPQITALKPMMDADMAMFRQYDTPVGGPGGGGWGGGGGGGGGGGYGGGVIGGTAIAGPVTVMPGINNALGVYPPVVDQGDKVTLQANPSELAKGMPSAAKAGAKGPAGKGPPNVDAVDFYRDSDGDGKFTPGKDAYLGTDKDGKDGYSLDVSTKDFPLGNMAYYAVPKNSAAADNSLPLSASLLTALAEAEAKIAKESAAAANGAGLSAERAEALAKEQAQIQSKISSIANDVKQAAPEVAKLLSDTRAPISKANGALGKAKKTPNEPSIGPAGEAQSNADVAAKQLALAAEKLTKVASGDEPPKPGSPGTGRPSAANGLINAPKGAPGPGGPGGPGGGGYDGDDKDKKDYKDVDDNGYRDVVDDDDIRRRWGLDDDVVLTDIDRRVYDGDRARRLVDDRDYDRAALEYDRLLVDDPDNLYLLRNRAHTSLQLGGYEEAITDYNQLITLDTENADFYYNRGCAYLAASKLDLAVADFSKSIELNETGHLAYNNRGITYARQGQFAKAVVDLTKALSLDPNDQLAYHNRGLAYSKLGKTAEAEADFAKAKALGEGG